MATAATPTPTIPPALSDALTNGLKLNITGTLPGEALITALIGYATEVRATMDPALMKRLDAITVQQIEDVQTLWRSIWVKLGVVR